jgi:hypothetical protein
MARKKWKDETRWPLDDARKVRKRKVDPDAKPLTCPQCKQSYDTWKDKAGVLWTAGESDGEHLCTRCRSIEGKLASLHLAVALDAEGFPGWLRAIGEWPQIRKSMIEREVRPDDRKTPSDKDLMERLIDLVRAEKEMSRNDAMGLPITEALSLMTPKPAAQKRRRRKARPAAASPKPLTAIQTQTIQVVSECEGNIAAAAHRLGKDRKTVEESYRTGMLRLGKEAYWNRHKTRLLARDRRGTEDVADVDDHLRNRSDVGPAHDADEHERNYRRRS